MTTTSPSPHRDETDSREVALDQLDTASFAVRSTLIDSQWVSHLQQCVDRWPPILVTETLTVLDGHHRIAAARRLGRTHLDVTVVAGLDPAEALEAAVAANSGHGLTLSRAEHRVLIDRLLHAAPEWSDRRIAAAVGVSPTTVGSRRRRASAPTEPAEHPGVQDGHLDRRVGRDGKSYPVAGVQLDNSTSSDVPSASLAAWRRALRWMVGTIRTARSRSSSGYFCGLRRAPLLVAMLHPRFQGQEHPRIPGRITAVISAKLPSSHLWEGTT